MTLDGGKTSAGERGNINVTEAFENAPLLLVILMMMPTSSNLVSDTP